MKFDFSGIAEVIAVLIDTVVKIVGMVLGSFLILLLALSVCDRVEFEDTQKQITVVRELAKYAPLCERPDLVALVQDKNEYIHSAHELNKIWMMDWVVSDKWDSVEKIPIPECK